MIRGAWLVLGLWLATAAVVLTVGLAHAPHSGGGVAMQMFVISLPSSLGVAKLLNEIGYRPTNTNGQVHIIMVWAPFFITGRLQALAIWATLRRFGRQFQNKAHKNEMP